MHIPQLLDLACLAVAIRIKGKTKAEMAEMFGVNMDEETPANDQQGTAMQTEQENSAK